MPTFKLNQYFLFKKSLIFLLFVNFISFSSLEAQCPACISTDGPAKIGMVGTCTPEAGMLQWDGTSFLGYDGSSWQNLMSGSSSSLWSINSNGINYDSGNVGIGLTLPTSSLHIQDLNITDNAIQLDFGTTLSSQFVNGIYIESEPLNTSQKGLQSGVYALTSSNYSSKNGHAIGILSESKAFFGDGRFIGVKGQAEASSLNNTQNGVYSSILGGNFCSNVDNINISSGDFWIGGIRAVLNGVVNGSISNGAIGAVVGIDNQTGTAQSWAGYFSGKGHFSNKVTIGTTLIPSIAGTYDVSDYNLFVTGGILTEEIVLETNNVWADYVFNNNYNLLPLTVVENFIKENGHLPNMLSAEEVSKNGIMVSETIIKQQEKIEELFLHSIALEKENKLLKKRLDDMEKILKTLNINQSSK